MPYIPQDDRPRFDAALRNLDPQTPGELNYCITKLCLRYVDREGTSYTTLNAVHGALHCADLELYRVVTAPYEDEKIKTNGVVR